MQIVLLSGGSGKRLWPLSNDVRSKQFIPIFKEGDRRVSMVKRVVGEIRRTLPEATLTIATAKNQISSLKNQLGDLVTLSVEPSRRDTFPAITLAAAFLHYERGVSLDETVVISPVDPYVKESFFAAFQDISRVVEENPAAITLMGVKPTYPSEKYGYIIPKSAEDISRVAVFREKPTREVAEEYIREGGLWNCGVFAFKLGYLLKRVRDVFPFTDYRDLYEHYEKLPKISFDYAVLEKEPSIFVKRYVGSWSDLGTWNTLTEAMEEPSIGKAILSETCRNTHVINETDLQVLCMGTKDLVVAVGADGILVSDKAESSYLKPFVDSFEVSARYAEKSWGTYRVIDIQKNALTIRVTLNPGHRMNYHSHARRDEVWTVLSGVGTSIVDGFAEEIHAGDIISISRGAKHTVIAKTELKIIEVQIGADIDVADKEIYDAPEG